MASVVPEKGLNFSVYADGGELLGVAEAKFPNGEFMTTEIKGAGIAGVIDSPGMGHMQSITAELTWRTTTKEWANLLSPVGHVLDMYADHLSFDSGLGVYKHSQIHAFMRAVPKSWDAGKLVVSESTETKTTHEIYYLKIDIDGVNVLEIDKYDFIYRVNGVNYLEQTRRNLGK